MVRVALLVFGVSMVSAWAVTPLAIRLGRWWGALDHPGPRKVHTQPVPRIGGVSVFVAFLTGLAVAAFATGFLPQGFPSRAGYWGSLAVAAAGIFAMGLIDDVRGLSFRWKFAIQIVAGVLVWWMGFRIEDLAVPLVPGGVSLGPLSVVVTVLWIVGVTNAINLIDGLDGLAAGVALISTVAVAVIAATRGQVAVTAASIALVGSLVGFLPYNFSPARIFLGDSGSMLLGFLLAVLSIHAAQKGTTAVAVLTPILVIGVPLADTSLAVFRRLYRLGRGGGEADRRISYLFRHATDVFRPDREHLHHRLLDLGLSQKGAVLTLYVGAVMTALVALSLALVNGRTLPALLLAVLAILVTGFLLATRFSRAGRPADPSDASPEQRWRSASWKPTLHDSAATPPE